MNKKHLAVFLTVVVIVLVGAAAIFVYYSSNKQTPAANTNGNVNQAGVPANENTNLVVTNANTAITNLNTNTVVTTNSATNTNTSITTATSLDPSGTIQWDGPKKIGSVKFFTSTPSGYNRETGVWGPDQTEANPAQYYSVGKFLSGQYEEGEIIIASSYPEGPAFGPEFYYLVRRNGRLTILQKHSPAQSTDNGVDYSKVETDYAYTISSLMLPSTLKVLKPEVTLSAKQYQREEFFDGAKVVKVFTDAQLGDAYVTKFDGSVSGKDTMSLNSVYFRVPDGTVQQYDVEVPFMNDESAPNVTWTGGQKNATVYSSTDVGGCGSLNSFSVVTPDTATVAKDMVAVGKTSTGDTVYGLKDTNHILLKNMYNENYYVMEGEKKAPYATFVANHPLFFWADPFGRVIKFSSSKYLPLAECGKPVIYLYPEKTTDVSVQLTPVGGFTYTEPAYGKGWKVRATPSGKLTDVLTNKPYPYLFWEGRGGMYQTPDRGFVVAQAGVHTFLEEKLTALGLNQQERADFIEFWEPRMQGAPHYFVTFMGNEVMDQLAPLAVSPKPDTIIRILMDYTPLQQPKAVQGYSIHTPQRKGFTVVEWGGVLRGE